MLPMRSVRLQLGTLLAADATTLAPATNANKVHLIGAPFTLNENLTAGGLTFITGNGLDPLTGVAGSQAVALDPVTQDQLITIDPPSGGWRWVSSGTISSPITVYGFALTDTTGATLIGAQSLPSPIVITAAGYQIDLDPIQITFILTPMS